MLCTKELMKKSLNKFNNEEIFLKANYILEWFFNEITKQHKNDKLLTCTIFYKNFDNWEMAIADCIMKSCRLLFIFFVNFSPIFTIQTQILLHNF